MPGPGDRGGTERPQDAGGTLRRILLYILDYKWIVLILVILAVLSNGGNLLGPSFAGKAINALTGGTGKVDFPTVLRYVLLMLIAYVVSNLLALGVSIGMMRISKKIAARMREDIFEKLMRLPVGFFDRNRVGDIISRASYDVDVVGTSLGTDVVQILTTLITVTGSFAMMCVISLPLTGCMLITIPASILYTRHMRKKTRPLYRERSASYGSLNGYVEEMFTGQRTILAYAREDEVCARFDEVNKAAADAYAAADGMGMTMGPTMGLINDVGLSLIGMTGALLYLYRIVSMGQISSFILYSRKFSGPINEIANIINEIFSALAAAERVFRLLDEPEEAADIYGARELKKVKGDVELRDVSFSYIKSRPILSHLSLRADRGKTIAIVGPTGAGKTTIINLLMRFYDVDEGKILVDQNEIRQLKMQSLRRSYAMVLQDTWVFKGSMYENIAYGKEGAAFEEVVAAAKAARIHQYILTLPEGYDTVITEDGNNISKGQKQLITIARAMLYDTSMLILDEATSNVDTNTERAVQKAMRSLMQGKTCFVIAHRLATIQNADNILVVDHGEVVEQGTHEELMGRKGFYYRMYASQFVGS